MYDLKTIANCGLSSISINTSCEFLEVWSVYNIKIRAYRYINNYIISFQHNDDSEIINIDSNTLYPLNNVNELWNNISSDVCIMSSIVESVQDILRDNCYNELINFLKDKYKEYDIYFTGYSLGGIISQLIMLHISQSSFNANKFICITFGKPLAGNLDFANYYNNHIKYCTNFVAKGDNIIAKKNNGFYEDTEAIILDNNETMTAGHHDIEYYKRCCLNLYKRRNQPMNNNMDKQKASLIIYRFFRTSAYINSLKHYVLKIKNSKIMSEWMITAPFEEISKQLRKRWIINIAKKTIERLLYILVRAAIRTKQSYNNTKLIDEKPNIRVFLAAFMLIARPDNCFETVGYLERNVLNSANELVNCFKDICNRIESNKSITLNDWCSYMPFIEKLNDYLTKFKDWKVPDENKLAERIKHAVTALYRAESHLTLNNPEYLSMKKEFGAQKIKLRSKMIQIAGVQALKELDNQLKEAGIFNEDLPTDNIQEIPNNTNASGLSSLPGRMTNEQLAHELLLDPTFKLDAEGAGYIDNPILSKVRESFKIAFWNSLVDDLKLSPPCYIRVIKVIGEVRDGIIDLVPSRSKELKEMIDTSYWREQSELKNLDWTSCISLIKGILYIIIEIAEPFRKEEIKTSIKNLEQEMIDSKPEQHPESFCKALEYVLSRVNIMRVDAANSRLRRIQHVINNHGVEYEQAHMAKKLKANPNYLIITPKWIHNTIDDELKNGRVDLTKIINGDASTYLNIYTAAVLNLIKNKEPLQISDCPETLKLDIIRLQKYNIDFHFDVTAACMIMMASKRIISKRKNDTRVIKFLEHLKLFLNKFEASNNNCLDESVNNAVTIFEQELTIEEKELIVSCMSNTDNLEYSRDMLNKLFEVPKIVLENSYKPIEDIWWKLLINNLKNTNDNMPQSLFIKNTYERILRNTHKMFKMINLNRKVHYNIYNDIITEYTKKKETKKRIEESDGDLAMKDPDSPKKAKVN